MCLSKLKCLPHVAFLSHNSMISRKSACSSCRAPALSAHARDAKKSPHRSNIYRALPPPAYSRARADLHATSAVVLTVDSRLHRTYSFSSFSHLDITSDHTVSAFDNMKRLH